jgi:predicted TIM-barrel fold metal-dependent hydrolase
MIVDCHTHVDFAVDDVGASEHLAAAETVDRCIVLASANGPEGKVNEKLSSYVGRHSGKMVGFAVINPTEGATSAKSIQASTKKLGLEGIVLYCSSCGFHPAHSRAMRFYESAEELGLPVFFHNSDQLGPDAVLEYAQPFLLDEVARTFSKLKIVIGAMGMPFFGQTLSMLAKHKNVYGDLTVKPSSTWEVYNIVTEAYEHGVMDKLLFGSGFPVGRAGECIEALLGFNKLLGEANLPTVPRGIIRNIIERDTLEVLGITKGQAL